MRKHRLIKLCIILYSLLASYAFAYERIVSIGGGLTEAIFAIGAQDKIIARDGTSYYPESVNELPDVGYMRMLDAEPIVAMNPDLILAKEGSGPASVLDQIKALGVNIEIMPTVKSIDALYAQITQLGALLESQEAATELNKKLKIQSENLEVKKQNLTQKPRVIGLLSTSPGNYRVAGGSTGIQLMINLTGAKNIFEDQQGYKNIDAEGMLQANPDYIFIGQINEKNIDAAKKQFLSTPVIGDNFTEDQIIMYDPLILFNIGVRSLTTAEEIVDIYLERQ